MGTGATVIGSDTATGGGSMVLNAPAGLLDGHLILIFATTTNATITTPTGFSVEWALDTLSSEMVYCFSKVASSEPSSWTVTATTTEAISAVVVIDTVTSVERYLLFDNNESPAMGSPGDEFILYGFLACFQATSAKTRNLYGDQPVIELTDGDRAIAVLAYDESYARPVNSTIIPLGYTYGRTFAVALA